MNPLSMDKVRRHGLLLGLGGRFFWLILIIASLTGRLYAQSPKKLSIADVNLFKCNDWNAGLDSSFSCFRGDATDIWRPVFDTRLSVSAMPLGNQMFSATSRLSEPAAIRPWPQDRKNPPKDRKKKKEQNYSANSGSPGHIFWVIPAFKVDYAKGFEPLTPKEKFKEWAQSSYDPMGLTVGAFEAGTLEYSSTDGFCGYGMGLAGYGDCIGSLELDATDSSFIGDFALPVVLHQDPRYFRLGKGSFGKRVWYAVSRVFVTYNDSGQTVFYSSALSGTVIAAGLSNFYYPSQDVGMSHTMTRIAIDLGNTALYNLAAEFWPDIDHKLHRAL